MRVCARSAASLTGARPCRRRATQACLGFPVALLRLISYALILLSLRMRGERAQLGGYALTLIAFTFSVYLTYREVFTIRAICSWCVASAIVFTLLAIVGALRVLRVEADRPVAASVP
jgi:uncharacterized membrane protein